MLNLQRIKTFTHLQFSVKVKLLYRNMFLIRSGILKIPLTVSKTLLFGIKNYEFMHKSQVHVKKLFVIDENMLSNLLTSFPKKNQISGLMTKSPKERILFTEESILGQEFRMYEKTLYGKVVMNFAGKFNLKENNDSMSKILMEGFTDVFGSLENITKSKTLSNIIFGKKEVTLTQHNINVFFGNKKFTYQTLQEFAGTQIDCSSYKNTEISIQVFIETFFIKKNLFNKS